MRNLAKHICMTGATGTGFQAGPRGVVARSATRSSLAS
jgi:hypothetical protein